jgi:outer membrane protein with beta-barrel domain
MMTRACLLAAVAVGFVGLAQPAAGQNTDRGDISAGYQFVNVFPSNGADNHAFPGGWYADFSGNITRSVAAVAAIGGNYTALPTTETHGTATVTYSIDLRVHEFMGGVRLRSRGRSAVTPFGQVLVGAAELTAVGTTWASIEGQPPYPRGSDSHVHFALQAGGGINVDLSKTLGVRVGADYLRVFSTDYLPADLNVFRLVTGLNFGF